MRLLQLAWVASLVMVASVAAADMPGNDRCSSQEGCVECVSELGGGDSAAYDACVADAKAAGLSLSCSEGQGSSDVEYWCPEGVDANNGCSVAAIGGTEACAVGLGLCIGAVALTLGRRRRA